MRLIAVLLVSLLPALVAMADEPAGTGDDVVDRQALEQKLRSQGVAVMPDQRTGTYTVIVNRPRADDHTLERLVELGQIRALTLSAGKFTAASFDSIAQLEDLEELIIFQFLVDGAQLEKLAGLPGLKKLTIHNAAKIDDEALGQFQKFPALENLSLSGQSPRITAAGLAGLAALPMLSSLQLGDGTVTDAGIAELAESQSLTSISLAGKRVTDESLRLLAAMEYLTDLNLSQAAITADGIRHLKNAKSLKKLGLHECPKIDDGALAAVAELTTLEQLSLAGKGITDAGLGQLNGLVHLRTLSLEPGCRATGSGLEGLTALDELEGLDVMGDDVSDAVFAHLDQFPKLAHITIGPGHPTKNPRITNEGLKQIGQCPQLQIIVLIGTAVTDAGLEALRDLPSLDTVFIHFSPGVKQQIWHPRRAPPAAAPREDS